MNSWKRLGVAATIVVTVTLAASVFQDTDTGLRGEQGLYDLRFKLRGPLPKPPHTPLTVFAVDPETFDRLQKPLVFWQPFFAEVLDHLVEAGVKVVGVDFIFTNTWDRDGFVRWVQSILAANEERAAVVLGYRVDGKKVDQLPFQLTVAAGPDGIGYVNLTSDTDDFVRRQELFKKNADGEVARGFAYAVVSSFLGGSPFDVVSLPDKPDTMLINYRDRGLRAFPTIPFWRAYEAAVNDDKAFFEKFRGQMVLVGEVGEEDRHPTPLYYWAKREETREPNREAGVFIHANTIATILERDFIRQVGAGWQLLLLLVTTALTVAFCLRLNPVPALLLCLALAVGLFAGAAFFFNRGVYLFLVGPLSVVAVGAGLSQAANYMLVGREKNRLRRLFSRYVNDEVIEELMRTRDLRLQGERKKISVLFSDIRNFTTRSESLAPEELVSHLNRYFEKMVEAILSNQGSVDKFIGDGIMAVFGAPLPDERCALHATQAGLAMMTALDELNREWVEEGLEPIRIGIGIHTGEAVVGNIGSPQRLEYTAIGDVVNTASRIEGLNKKLGTDFLVSGATQADLDGKIAVEYLADETVKGKSRAVPVYRVVFPSEPVNPPAA